MHSNCLPLEEMASAMCPGVWPGAVRARIPGAISVSWSTSSNCPWVGGRFLRANFRKTSLPCLSSFASACPEVQKSHSPFHITYRASGKTRLPLSSVFPPMWSGCPCVKTTVSMSSGAIPAACRFWRSFPVLGAGKTAGTRIYQHLVLACVNHQTDVWTCPLQPLFWL